MEIDTPSTKRPARSSVTPERDAQSEHNSDDAGVNSPVILTPGAKIRAIMAAYDTDTDSEGEREKQTETNRSTHPSNAGGNSNDSAKMKQPVSRALFTPFAAANFYRPRDDDGDAAEEEDELPMQPKGRMAARMQTSAVEQSATTTASAYERVSKGMIQAREDTTASDKGIRPPSSEDEDEDEDVRGVGRRRSSAAARESRRSYSPLFVPEGSPKLNATTDNDMETDDEVQTTMRRRTGCGGRSASITSNRSFSPLFVSQDSPTTKRNNGATRDAMETDDEDEGLGPPNHNRLMALVEKKRKEREAREQLEEEKKAARLQRSSEVQETILSSDRLSDDADDSESGRKLTQHSRPSARKASKKALLEMNRETQRMSRNMQLAHQAVTRKKITLDSFLAKFNSKSSSLNAAEATSSAPASSDHEEGQARYSTPPTSPLREGISEDKPVEEAGEDSSKRISVSKDDDNIYIPSVEEIFAGSAQVSHEPVDPSRPERQASKAPSVTPAPGIPSKTTRPVRIRLSRQSIEESQKNNTDSDLEIITSPAKTRRIAVFENLPTRNNQSCSTLLKLRTLAQLTSPTRQRQTTMMTRSELDNNLFRRARLQALQERQEKIEELRAKGVVIETAEERMRVNDEVEDLLEKARGQAEEIARRERKAAKKDGRHLDAVDLDDSEDGDYQGADGEVLSESDEEEGEDIIVSDDEEVEAEELEEDDRRVDEGEEGTGFVHNEADEAEVSEDEGEESESGNHQVQRTDGNFPRRNRRRVISDDEDEDGNVDVAPISQETPVRSQARPLFPDFGASRTPLMGLTQAFGATFADSQDNEEDSLAMLRRMPDIECPVDQLLLERDSQEIVRDSQGQDSVPLDLFASYPRADGEDRVSESPAARTVTSYSQAPEPTQDAGFVYSPFDQGKRFTDVHARVPTSTIDTVPVGEDQSPIARRTGGTRILRRGPVADLSDVDEDDDEGFLVKSSAFDVMRRAANKKTQKTSQTPFDKSKSRARDVIDEVAEESEDEYAGLGGASDESAGEEDEIDLSMINDDGGEVVDEKELAALNANHSRQQDEQQVNKLMRDIATGALRRRRGAGGDDLDLSDSDDERLAARRRAKRREFAKMRKALLADEKIGQIAEDPKKTAFLRTIEDRDVDNDVPMVDFLEGGNTSSSQDTSQDNTVSGHQQQQEGGANDHFAERENVSAIGNNKRKRPLDQSGPDALNRPPPHMRRTAENPSRKKPLTLAEIRESVSFLLDGGDSNASESFDEDILLSDEETERETEVTNEQQREDDIETRLFSADDNNDSNDNSDKPIQAPANGRGVTGSDYNHIHPRRRQRGKVVDRLSLRRQASSNAASGSTTSTTASGSRQAFFSNDSTPLFKRPPLLIRRATASSSSSSSSSSAAATAAVTYGAKPVVSVTESRAGMQLQGKNGKKGSVNYYAAARERQREWELRRGERGVERRGLAKGGKPTGGVLGGLLGGGGGSDRLSGITSPFLGAIFG
ncbi:hypothetical protein BDDG_03259 [Blastomyces dermatitidis ATCC 18188]|uniref:DNA replication checkpoint mediator MRC1 domain-containing protein n=1 Tax=Ajellomyces dermatitidis (strain ATCC 18188 / CBS 674.68) TaxID=653446 RepID=F2TAQ5_AJEDA|nr:hypothetical protein BDDG_03259 [Blastomyces dermatitidis ATCC 18188]